MAQSILDEAARLHALRECLLPAGARDDGLDAIVRDAAHVCEAPIAMINLVDADDLRFEATVGWSPRAISRTDSICSSAIAQDGVFVVPDARADPEFAERWFVVNEPHVRFYAGVPLVLTDGAAIGTLCVMDRVPRVLRAEQLRALRSHAAHAAALLELRRARARIEQFAEARDQSEQLFRLLAQHSMDIIGRCAPTGVCSYISPSVETVLGYRPDEMIGVDIAFLVHPDDQPLLGETLARAEEARESQLVTYRTRRKNGEYGWFETTLTPIFHTETGEMYEVQLSGRDVTARRQADDALRASEERFRHLAENASDLISRHAPDGAFLYASPSAFTLLGYTPAELVGTQSMRLVHRDDRAHVIEQLAERPPNAVPGITVTCRMRHKDGHYIWMESTDRVLYDDGGEIVEFQSVSRNVSKRIYAEQALRASEERFRKIFEESPLAISVTDSDLRFEKVNRAFCDMLGYSEHELLSLTALDITHPADLPGTVTSARRLFAGEVETHHVEKRYITKSGETIWTNLTASLIETGAAGTLSGIAMIEDITARRQVRDQLLASEERFRRVFEDGPVGMSITTQDLRFVRVNAAFCQMVGYSEAELMQMTVADISYPEEMAENLRVLRAMYEGEVPAFQLEKRYLTKSGATICAQVTSAMIQSAFDAPQFGLAIIEDITERKQAETALHDLAALKSDFVALVSHELRAPLTNMNGAIELIGDRAGELPADTRRTLEILSQQTNRLTQLVASILDVSRLDAGQLPITLGPVAVDVIAAQAIAAVSAQEPAPNVRLTVLGPLPLAWADEVYVRQVIDNLIRNAVKHSAAAAAIAIELRATDEHVLIFVTDNGRGIRIEEQQHIFDAFFRSPHAGATTDGHGLGLYFARKLIEAQGGTIAVQSPAYDDAAAPGTRFSIRLPIAADGA